MTTRDQLLVLAYEVGRRRPGGRRATRRRRRIAGPELPAVDESARAGTVIRSARRSDRLRKGRQLVLSGRGILHRSGVRGGDVVRLERRSPAGHMVRFPDVGVARGTLGTVPPETQTWPPVPRSGAKVRASAGWAARTRTRLAARPRRRGRRGSRLTDAIAHEAFRARPLVFAKPWPRAGSSWARPACRRLIGAQLAPGRARDAVRTPGRAGVKTLPRPTRPVTALPRPSRPWPSRTRTSRPRIAQTEASRRAGGAEPAWAARTSRPKRSLAR